MLNNSARYEQLLLLSAGTKKASCTLNYNTFHRFILNKVQIELTKTCYKTSQLLKLKFLTSRLNPKLPSNQPEFIKLF